MNHIIENLFKIMPTAEDWREASEGAEGAAVGVPPGTGLRKKLQCSSDQPDDGTCKITLPRSAWE